MSEEKLDNLVADVAGSLAVLVDKHPDITPAEVWDRARNIVQALFQHPSLDVLR